MGMRLSRYVTRFHDPGDRGQVTLFSTRTASVVSVEPAVLRDIELDRLPAGERKLLASEGLLVRSPRAEEREMLGYIDGLNEENSAFGAVVVLNLDCNLACTYCFEGTRKGEHFLSPATAKQFVDFVRTRDLDGKDEISLVFYGGEPLLSQDAIARISEELGPFAEARGLDYRFSLITNGTLLTPRVVERLKPLGLAGASVTLDGPREVHDRYRPFKSGRGSFDVIAGNVRDVCGLIDVQLGGNYTRDHYREFPRLLDCLLERGLAPGRIPFVKFDPVVRERAEFAPPGFHEGCRSIDEPWLVEAGLFLRGEILKRGFRTQEIAPSVCMMEFRDSVVVNYDGTLYKCPGLIGTKDCRVGDLRTGPADCRRSHGLDNWKNGACLACCYLPLCFGGCRYLKLLREGTMQGVDCRKRYFDRALGPLVLQDVRYQHANGS